MTDKDFVKAGRYVINILKTMVCRTPLEEKPEDVSFGDVYKIAKFHSLASAVFYYVEDRVKFLGSEELFSLWEKERNIDFARNMTQTSEFRRITGALSQSEIKFLPLKGFLLKALYPRPEVRTMGDIDILVSPSDIERAKEVLIPLGYKPEKNPSYDVHESLDKPPFMHIELHRMLFSEGDFDFADAVQKEGCPFWYLMRDDDFLIFHLRHAKKHYESGGCGIRAVLDHYLLLNKYSETFESPEFNKKISDAGLSEFTKIITELALFWFGDKVPEEDISEFEIYTLTGGTYGTLDNRTDFAIRKKGNKNYLLKVAFPPAKTIKARYVWVKKCPILLPIGYIVRIVASIFNGRVKEYSDAAKKSKNKETN